MKENKIFKVIIGMIALVFGLKLLGFILSLLFGLAFPLVLFGGFILVPLIFLMLAIALPIILIYGIYKYFFKKDYLD